jgi:hypothetical protein
MSAMAHAEVIIDGRGYRVPIIKESISRQTLGLSAFCIRAACDAVRQY